MKCKLQSIEFGLILVLAGSAAAQNTPDSLPDRSIASLSEQSAETMDPNVVDPALEALKALDEPTSPPSTNAMPSLYRLAALEVKYEEFSSEDERLQAELKKAFQARDEATIMIRNNQFALGEDIILDALNQVTMDRPRLALLNFIGTAFFRQQRYEDAATYMTQAADLDPQNAALISNLSAALLSIERVDEALKYLNGINVERIQNRNLVFSIFFNKACGYSLKSDVDEAIQSLRIAATVDTAATFASLGDTQLDNIRFHQRYITFEKQLKAAIDRSEK